MTRVVIEMVVSWKKNFRNASVDLCPVFCWIIFSSIPCLNISVAPKALKLWFVYSVVKFAFLLIVFMMLARVFLPNGTSVNHGAIGSSSALARGRR